MPQEAALKPFQVILSKTARRAYLTTFLVIFAGLVLLGFAVTAYTLFYWSYIPRIGFERTIYLQFDNVYHSEDSRYDRAGNPYGTTVLSPDIVSMQRYDVSLELALPRTPQNRDAGNFMLEGNMYAPGSVLDNVKDTLASGQAEADNKLATSRRSAILPYRSIPLEYLYRLSELHWYLLGWRTEEDKLTVSLWEGVEFSKGWRNIPAMMKLEIQSTNRMQIYSAKVMFRARFRGLRWLMYNHRIISAALFISGFWMTEMLFTGLAWAVLNFYLQSGPATKTEKAPYSPERIKREGDEDEKPRLSDTERMFPTTRGQQPLRYESPPIKQEDDEPYVVPQAASKATEADDEDEDEDADVFIDSGLGTSLESSANRRESVRRRKARIGSGDGMK